MATKVDDKDAKMKEEIAKVLESEAKQMRSSIKPFSAGSINHEPFIVDKAIEKNAVEAGSPDMHQRATEQTEQVRAEADEQPDTPATQELSASPRMTTSLLVLDMKQMRSARRDAEKAGRKKELISEMKHNLNNASMIEHKQIFKEEILGTNYLMHRERVQRQKQNHKMKVIILGDANHSLGP